jgi:polar amino acid transport system permease protein
VEGETGFLEVLLHKFGNWALLLSLGDHGYGDEMLWGALTTFEISLLAYLIGIMIGLAGALGKLGGNIVLGSFLNLYTTFVRASPDLILILLVYYAGTDLLNRSLAAYGFTTVRVSGFAAAVGVLGFIQGAYATEVLRAAIQSIPFGQIEAARAFGMTPGLRLRRIIIPAMMPLAIPGMANLWLIVTKASSLIAVVGYTELLLATRQAAGNTKAYLLFYTAAAFGYLVITLVSNQAFKRAEVYYRRGMPKVG